MTDENSGVQSTKVLIIALVIGAIVAIVYNVHISNVRKQGQPEMAEVLCFDHDMFAGDPIRPGKGIAVTKVPLSVMKSIIGVVEKKALAQVEKVGVLNQNVLKGQLVFWHHVRADEGDAPSRKIGEGKVAVGLPLDSQRVHGDILRKGDLVNVLGIFSVKDKNNKPVLRIYRIIEGVQVLSIGGAGTNRPGRSRRSASSGLRSYRKISVAVDKDVSLALLNLLTHAQGKKVCLELFNPTDRLGKNAGQINPDLAELAKTAAGDTRPN